MTQFPAEFIYKTQPRGKQAEVIERSWAETSHALLCRPGTGKTKLGLDTAALNFIAGRIDTLLVIAPEGVDRQWITEGVPTHLSDVVSRQCYNYRSDMGKQAFSSLELALAKHRNVLLILTISFDGLQTVRGKTLMNRYFIGKRCYMCIDDESHRTANIKSAVYKAVKPVMRAARVRRISTGTLIRQNPFSAYGQFELMGPGLLGFGSLASFKSMYAQLLPPDDWLVKRLTDRLPRKPGTKEPVYIPKIVAKDEDGRPVYRNLADLRRRLAFYSSFLSLADVNGTEPVVNETPRYVSLTREQRALYTDLVKYGVAQAPNGQLTTEGALALAIRLAQVAGGFAPSDDDPDERPVGTSNPKINELMALIDELGDEKLVIWCKFSAEIDAVVAAVTGLYGVDSCVQYHGRMTSKQKDQSKQAFIKSSGCRFFVGQQRAGGTGLDGLQGVASYMAFFSNDYSALERLQAISRLARTDGASVVQVWDLIAEHTIDEDVVTCLRTAQDVSDAILRRAIIRQWD